MTELTFIEQRYDGSLTLPSGVMLPQPELEFLQTSLIANTPSNNRSIEDNAIATGKCIGADYILVGPDSMWAQTLCAKPVTFFRKRNVTVEFLNDQIRRAKFRRNRELITIQKKCSHPKEHVVECSYESFQYWDSSSVIYPRRVCTICGYSEEGWGCGYWKLNYSHSDVREVSRAEVVKYTRRFFDQEKLNRVRFDRPKIRRLNREACQS